MIKLNNLHKVLFLLFFSSCTVPVVEKENENIVTEKVSNESFFTKTSVNLSNVEDYEIQLSTLESFIISNDLSDYEISHKNLPYPGVAKISNPNDLTEYIVVRNVKNITNSKLQISENLASLLQVNTRIYIEYLKDESLRLRKVEDSKEQSKVKMDDTEISFENLEDEQTELSSSLDMEKIKEIETLSKNYEGLVLIDSYNDIGSAKLITNKIRNLGLIFEENENKINVFNQINEDHIKIQFSFEGSILKPGVYFLTFSLRGKTGKPIHKEERTIQFEIIDTKTYRGMKNRYRESAIIAPTAYFDVI